MINGAVRTIVLPVVIFVSDAAAFMPEFMNSILAILDKCPKDDLRKSLENMAAVVSNAVARRLEARLESSSRYYMFLFVTHGAVQMRSEVLFLLIHTRLSHARLGVHVEGQATLTTDHDVSVG